MPLRCLNDARETIYGFDLDGLAWSALETANRTRRHLRTHCCDGPVALKTSRLGTRFFAHLSRGGCATGDETPEHLHLKWLAVKAAQARGWHAATEVSGTTPAGEPWRADVLATRGRHRVAVEVQWSGQVGDETLRRQVRYAESGVRGLWLFRQPGFCASGDLPAMRVRGSLAKGFTAFERPIADVLDAAFDRRFRFGIPTGAVATMSVGSVVVECWNRDCAALNRPIVDVLIDFGLNRCRFSLKALSDWPDLVAAIVARLPADRVRGRIRLRTSKAGTYMSNGCFRCDRLLGDGFLPGALASRALIATIPVTIDARWRQAIDACGEFSPEWSVVAPAAASR